MKKFLVLVFILISVFPAHAEKFIELRIISAIGGSVRAVMPDGTKIALGRILMLPEKLNYNAYTASKWASPSAVSASAVNALHILVDVSGDRGKIFSLIPLVTTAPAARPKTAFFADIPPGIGIFGGFAPLTGSKVSIIRRGIEYPLSGVPLNGDVVVIRTPIRDAHGVYMVDFENRPGGRVIAHTGEGAQVIARVVRRIRGAGRFGGTKYQDAGRIRASHSGVIDISMSKAGEIGGFQIIPLRHALTSHELHYVWRFTQYMVAAPLPGQPDLEGRPPLFSGELMPGPNSGDKESDIWERYRQIPLVFCRRDGGKWEKLPEASGRVDDAFDDVTHLRIYFPIWKSYPEMY